MLNKISEKNKRLVFNIGGAVTVKGCSVLISFFTTPGFISYFNDTSVLGIWFTVLSILNWIMMFDLGIGNGLRNKLAKSIVNSNLIDMRKQISSAYIILGIVTLSFFILGEILIYIIDWNVLLNISPLIITNGILKLSVAVIYGGIILQFWLKLITSVLLAIQKNILVGVLLIVTNITILIYLYCPISVIDISSKLIALSIVYVFAINVPMIIASIYLFLTKFRNAFPRMRYYDRFEARNVLNLGTSFFIIQLALMMINSTNEWLITFLYSSDSVVDYQIYFRIFNLIIVLFSLITQPIWSSVTVEYERRNFSWIRKVYKLLNLIVLFFLPLIIIIIFMFDSIINTWLGEGVVNSKTITILLFSVFTLEMLHINASTCIANGTGKLKCQFYLLLSAAIIKFPLTFFLSNFIDEWEIVMVVNTLVLIPMVIFQPITIKKFLKENSDSLRNKNFNI